MAVIAIECYNLHIFLQRLRMKTMRSLLFTISLLVVFSSAAFCDELKVQKDEVEQVITDILYLAKEGDVKTLNERYVNKEFGIFDVYRIGVPDEFEGVGCLAS